MKPQTRLNTKLIQDLQLSQEHTNRTHQNSLDDDLNSQKTKTTGLAAKGKREVHPKHMLTLKQHGLQRARAGPKRDDVLLREGLTPPISDMSTMHKNMLQ